MTSVDGLCGTLTTTYTFNPLGQETAAGATSYTYDGLGRALTSGTTSLTYSGMGNNVSSDGSATYQLDPAGAIIADQTSGGPISQTLTDTHDNLVAEFGSTATSLTGWQTYDPLGNITGNSNWSAAVGYQFGLTDNPLASCHNIPAATGGSNVNKGNLTACVHVGTNISGYSMRWVEALAIDLADEGFTVYYKAVDNYSASTSTIPNGYGYTLKVWDPADDYDFTLRYQVANENIGNW